jgi:hydroxyacylglutathione hydrolase
MAAEPSSVLIETFPVGPLQCNCTILGDPATHEAIVIDPGDEISRIHRRLTELGLTLKQILITHAHIDHIGGALKLKHLTGAPILLNEADLPLLKMMEAQAGWLGIETPETATPDASLANGLTVGLDSAPAQVLHTPGHTQGSVCLYFAPPQPAASNQSSPPPAPAGHGLLIAGDTLFAGSIGRTDLPGGNSRQILDSIHTHLLVLPEDTQVLPGHGPLTTIGDEKYRNPFLTLR